jgi:hypothetical protein
MPRTPDLRIVGAGLCCVLALTAAAVAGETWVLWSRTCDVQSSECSGQWRRGQTYEAERWCRAARTLAVNEALTPEGRTAAHARGTVVEYQCLPDTAAPSGPKGNK